MAEHIEAVLRATIQCILPNKIKKQVKNNEIKQDLFKQVNSGTGPFPLNQKLKRKVAKGLNAGVKFQWLKKQIYCDEKLWWGGLGGLTTILCCRHLM